MSDQTLFITGASGLLGRRLCRRLSGKAAPALRCLSRNLAASPERNATWVNGSLGDTQAWSAALAGSDAIVHLAGRTGRARPDEFTALNVEGTRALIAACRTSGVRRLCYVSSVAVNFPDLHAYPWAASLRAAEELVRTSDLNWTIVRLGLVLGPRAPASARLAALARLPLMPSPGSARVQPVHLDDVAEALARWFDTPEFDGRVHELGGPEVIAMPELLARARLQLKGARKNPLPLPGKAMISALWTLEGFLRPVLPVLAAPLHEFVFDGLTEDGPLATSLKPELKPLADMLRDLGRY